MNNPLKILISYDYRNTPLSCGNQIEEAFRRRSDCEVYRYGELDPKAADVCFNTLAASPWPRGPLTIWWDIEACSYHVPEQFNSDIVLAPYTYDLNAYQQENSYFCPFAVDPIRWHYRPDQELKYDLMFVGREDMTREYRVDHLNYLEGKFNWLRTNHIERGVEMSKLLSQSKIALQISGDQGHVMETRFFEIGLITVLAADRLPEFNAMDLDWAAVPDYHYIAYNGKEEMVEKIGRMIKDDDARMKMRERAWKNYRENHTYDVRVRQILETIGFLKGPGLEKLHAPRKKWVEYGKF